MKRVIPWYCPKCGCINSHITNASAMTYSDESKLGFAEFCITCEGCGYSETVRAREHKGEVEILISDGTPKGIMDF